MTKFSIPIFPFVLLFAISSVFSQSLYHDAWRLKELIEGQSVAVLHFSENDVGVQYSVGNGPVTIVSGPVVLDSVATYHFKKTGGTTTDTVLLTYHNDTIPIYWTEAFELDNMPGLLAWTVFYPAKRVEGAGTLSLRTTEEEATWHITRDLTVVSPADGVFSASFAQPGHYRIYRPHTLQIEYEGFDSVFVLPGEAYYLNVVIGPEGAVFQMQSKWHARQYLKKDYYELIALLALHGNIQDSTFSEATLDSVYLKYKSNNYLRPLLHDFLYAYDLNEVRDRMNFNYEWADSLLRAKVQQGYQWQNVLYHNAALDPKEMALSNGEAYYQKLDTSAFASPYLLQIAAESSNADYRNVRGFDTQSFITGLSDFLVDRAQEELNISFMYKFERFMEEHPEMSTLFPRTMEVFLQFNVYNYKKLLQDARPAFANDLDHLGLSIPRLLDLPKYEKLLDHSAEVYNLALFYEISKMVYEQRPLEDILLQSYRSVARREQHLGEIVNLQLARKLGRANPAMKAIRADVVQYSQLLDSIATSIGTAGAGLQSAILGLNGEVSPGTDPLLFREVGDIANRFSLLHDITTSPRYQFSQPGIPVLEAPDYFENYTANYLNGQGYYGGYLQEDNPTLSEYNDVFAERPDPVHYVAKGLEMTRVLIGENYTDALQKQLFDIDRLNAEAKEVKKKIILKKRLTLPNRLDHHLKLRESLAQGIREETARWEANGFPAATDVDVAALQYLGNLLDSTRQAPWNRLYVVKGLMDLGLGIDEALAAEGLSREDLELFLARSDNRLQAVYTKALARLDTLMKYKTGFPPVVNRFFSKYETDRLAFLQVGEEELGGIAGFDGIFQSAQQQISRLADAKERIRMQLIRLEEEHCSRPLLKARKNATDLKMSLDFAINLLYSLKDREAPDTIYYVDTVDVQYRIRSASASGQDSTLTFSKKEIQLQKGKVLGKKVRWITKSQYDRLLLSNGESTPVGQQAFLGLLLSRLNSVERVANVSPEGLPVLTSKLFHTVFEMRGHRLSFNNKKKSGQKLAFKDYYPFLKTTIGILNTAIETPVFRGLSMAQAYPTLALVPQLTNEGLSLYENLSAREYGFAIYNAMEIFRTIMDASIARQEASGKDIRKAEKFRNKALLYGTFMADVVSARNPDQVKVALSAAASPPGSSRLKRDLTTNLALNGYIGLGIGADWLRNAPEGINNPQPTIGLSVPIGLSWSTKFKTDMPGSFSLFAPVLDIGAITSFRIDGNAQTNDLPELNFNNIIAPGAFVFYNFPNAPISIGSGWQYGPQLRKIEVDGVVKEFRSSRFMFLNILVDVPLFNFSNGSPTFSN